MRAMLLASLIILAGCGGTREFTPAELREHARGMNVVLVVMDAANASHFSYMGYGHATTPNVDRLAREAVVFTNTYAQASATPLSMYSMMTSRYPILEEDQYSKTGELAAIIPSAMPTLATWAAERFASRSAFLGNRWLREELGFHHGYSTFDKAWEGLSDTEAPRADVLTNRFAAWLDRDPDGPWFSWVHYFEPHEPYTPPEPWFSMFDPEARGHTDGTGESLQPFREETPDDLFLRNTVALYDGNLAWVDSEFGRLVDALKASGEWDRTIVIVTSDHGEAFWEHGVRGHGTHVYEEFVRVPLVVRVPGLAPRRIDHPVGLIDVTPTILDLAGVFVPGGSVAGQSLAGPMCGQAPAREMAYFRNHKSGFIELGVRRGPLKFHEYVYRGDFELFDLGHDPAEKTNLLTQPGDRAEAIRTLGQGMLDALQSWVKAGGGVGGDLSPSASGADSLDADTIEALRAIGYFGGN